MNGVRPYDILFGRGAFGQLGTELPKRCPDLRSACLICDNTVAALYAERAEAVLRGLGYAVSRFSFSETGNPDSPSVLEKLVGHLRETGLKKGGLLVALGGTDVSALVGFTAGTYGEGNRWIAIATTLSSMIAPRKDERYGLRVGGITGEISVTNPPELVICDTEFLETLPDTYVRSGYAHIVRYSVMGFDGVTKSLPKIRDLKIPAFGSSVELPSEETVIESVKASVSVIPVAGADHPEYFGEKLAGAIESASGFTVSRGYAIASAMGILAQMSVAAGYCDRRRYRYLTTRLMQFGLPTGTSYTMEELHGDAVSANGNGDEDAEISVTVLKDVGCECVSMTAKRCSELLGSALATCRTVCAGTVRQEELYLPYSKELVMRMALAWFLDGFSLLDLSQMPGDDIRSMDQCLRELLTVEELPLPCGESATAFRLLLPLIGALDIDNVHFSLGEGLFLRPHEEYLRLLRMHGMTISVDKNRREYVASGRLTPGEYEFQDRNAAEQVCGLLFTLPLLHGDSIIRVPCDLYRKNLIHMTINVLHVAGVSVEIAEDAYLVRGEQKYDRFGLRGITPERDWSIAAMFEVLSFITGEDVTVVELPKVSLQAEQIITTYMQSLRDAMAEGETELRLDLSDVPSLIPCVALAASLADGVTVTITGLDVLKDREGNRIQSIALVLATLGADIRIEQVPEHGEQETDAEEDTSVPAEPAIPMTDAYIIQGRGCLGGGVVDSMGDHRIAMMAAVAAWGCEQPVTVTDADVVNRSFPGFFDELFRLI